MTDHTRETQAWLDRAYGRARNVTPALRAALTFSDEPAILVAIEAQEQAIEAIADAKRKVGGA